MLDLDHCKIGGSNFIDSVGDSRYLLTFIDDHFRYGFLFKLINKKTEFLACFIK